MYWSMPPDTPFITGRGGTQPHKSSPPIWRVCDDTPPALQLWDNRRTPAWFPDQFFLDGKSLYCDFIPPSSHGGWWLRTQTQVLITRVQISALLPVSCMTLDLRILLNISSVKWTYNYYLFHRVIVKIKSINMCKVLFIKSVWYIDLPTKH